MEPPGQQQFVTTRWSLILEAGRRSEPDADAALDTLCRAYWFPLYAFARRRGCSQDDAADLTQEFFAQLIQKSFLETADPERGRFRTFLLTIFQRFLARQQQRNQAVKRGGGLHRLPLDFDDGEARYASSLTDDQTPEHIFERQWALTLLERVIEKLKTEYADRGKTELFDRCRVFLTGSADMYGYSDAAMQLQMTEGAVRVAVHRLRVRYRELLRQEVAGTIADESLIDEEICCLRRAIQ